MLAIDLKGRKGGRKSKTGMRIAWRTTSRAYSQLRLRFGRRVRKKRAHLFRQHMMADSYNSLSAT
ncbi:hypothetical protein OKW30_008044 [Paraburkholderia sp. Clong3]